MSGIRWASTKNFDWFGAYGLVTAIGGGTTRDLLLNATHFWMQDATYLTVTGLALLAMLLFRKDFCALACITAGIIYMICYQSGLSASLTELLAA